MKVAEIILEQMGGNKFRAMTGAKNFLSHENKALSFQLPSRFAKDGINYVKITLNESDTYDMEFGKIWGKSYKVVKTSNDVYCDMLQNIFTAVTGLDTHL